ncbi:hypothetical protein [Paenisporosarcina sp. TG20]|nr:hypothetical protein [Paenisporosarcina sp. TG20]
MGLWKAWHRYDSTKGNFAPFAFVAYAAACWMNLKKG